jgi:hypothetical protein
MLPPRHRNNATSWRARLARFARVRGQPPEMTASNRPVPPRYCHRRLSVLSLCSSGRYDYRLGRIRRTLSTGEYSPKGDGKTSFTLKQARDEHEGARAAVEAGSAPDLSRTRWEHTAEHIQVRGILLRKCVEEKMRNYLVAVTLIGALATPALADEVGVRVGPAGAGVTTGEAHDRDRDRTVVKEREPESKTVIKKEDEYGNREKKVITHDRD